MTERIIEMLYDELKTVNDQLVYLGNKPEQYKDAIVGLSHDNNHIIYSHNRFIECLMKDGMSKEEAIEWTDHNTIRSLPYIGEYAPIVMFDIEGNGK